MAGEITTMEDQQAQYWMWMKRRQVVKSNFEASWEEKAFAVDAYGADHRGGGCIWPPRSYSCSFCKREFRSAQALGGHMNVHRRDRARLKQSLISPHNDVFQHENHGRSHFTSSPRVSSALCTHSSSSIAKEQLIKGPPDMFSLSGSAPWEALNHSKCLNQDYLIEADLVMSLDFDISQQVFAAAGSCSDEGIRCKRLKTTGSALSEPYSGNKIILQPESVGSNSTSMEDIDLELRLGEQPKR